MDPSREVIESAKPPKPPRWPRRSVAADPGGSPEAVDSERTTNPFVWAVVVCAVATAAFTGITAWETHQDRRNTEVIYCTIFSNPGPEGEERTLSEAEQKMANQLGC